MAKTCVKCGSTEFYVSGGCKPCNKASSAKYRSENAEKVKATLAAWYTRNVEKVKENSAKWKKNNGEKEKARLARWAKENPEKMKARMARHQITEKAKDTREKWRKSNPEKIYAYQKKYQVTHPQKFRIKSHNRRAKINAIGGKLSTGLAEKLFKLQRGKCACCGKKLGDNYHLDHRMPIALGGANEDWNMQLLTPQCNNQKHSKHPVDFMQSRGLLL